MLALMQGETPQDVTGDNLESQEVPSDFSDAIFARRLREVREQAGMTQQQLADQMARTGNKIHRSTVGKIENGDRPVTIGEAVQFAGILGVGLAVLLTDAGQDEAHRRRVEAQVEVRSLQHLAAERYRLLQEQQVLYDNAVDRLRAAERRVAELGGEAPAWSPPDIEATIPMQSKDDK